MVGLVRECLLCQLTVGRNHVSLLVSLWRRWFNVILVHVLVKLIIRIMRVIGVKRCRGVFED